MKLKRFVFKLKPRGLINKKIKTRSTKKMALINYKNLRAEILLCRSLINVILDSEKKYLLNTNHITTRLKNTVRKKEKVLIKYDFDMLKKDIIKKYKSRVLDGVLDFETIALKISDIPEEFQAFLLDSTEDFYNLLILGEMLDNNALSVENSDISNNFIRKKSNMDLKNDPCILLPITYGIAFSVNNNDDTNAVEEEPVFLTMEFNGIENTPKALIEHSIKLMESFFNHLESIHQTYCKDFSDFFFYAHNAGRFDSYLIAYWHLKLNCKNLFNNNLKVLKKDNTYLELNLGKGIKIRDSMQLLPGSLNNLGLKLVKRGKMELPFKRFTLDLFGHDENAKIKWSDLFKYVKADCILLYDILKILDKFLIEHFKCHYYDKLTIASLTVYIFFSQFYKPFYNSNEKIWNKSIYALTYEQEAAIRESYHGGRTEVFRPKLGPGVYYDLNSAYVSVMMEKNMPAGKPIGPIKVEDSIGFFHYSLNQFFGFAKAEVFAPPSFEQAFVLPHKFRDGNLIFPGGTFSGWFFSEELLLAKKNGYIILVKEVIYFKKSKNIFKEYLTKLGKIREDYNKDQPYNLLAKNLGNNLYGRFAMQKENNKHIICFSEKEIYKMEKTHQILDIFQQIDKDNNKIFSFDVRKISTIKDYDPNSIKFLVKQVHEKVAPHISAAVAAYVRILLAETLLEDKNRLIAYCDTDSIFVTKEFEPKKINPNKTGYWKKEEEFDSARFFAQKFYELTQKDEKTDIEIKKLKAKGFSKPYREAIESKVYDDLLTNKETIVTIEGDIENQRSTLQPDPKNNIIFEKARSTTISSNSVENHTKRIFDIEGNWVACQPFVVIDHKKTTQGNYINLYIKMKILIDDYKNNMSYNDYVEKQNIFLNNEIEKAKIKDHQTDPINTISQWKLNPKTSTFKKKTKEEIYVNYELTVEKYNILQKFRLIDQKKHPLSSKEKKLFRQLELYLLGFMNEYQCTESEVLEKLKDQENKKINKLEEKWEELKQTEFKDKIILKDYISLLEEKENILKKEITTDISYDFKKSKNKKLNKKKE